MGLGLGIGGWGLSGHRSGDSTGGGDLKWLKWRRIKKNWSWVKLEADGAEKIEPMSAMGAGRQVEMGIGGAGLWGDIGHQWRLCGAKMRTEQEWGAGGLTPACGIVEHHPGAWAQAHSHHLAPQQQALHQHPGEGNQKEEVHCSRNGHTRHLR